MKTIKTLYLLLLAMLAVSCDMDKEPYGILIDEDAILSPEDCRSYRNGLYVTMRSLTTNTFINFSDLQTDLYHAVSGNGNPPGSSLYNGNLQPGIDEFDGIWGSYYATIGSVNFLINKTIPLLESNRFTEQENIEMRRYMGEALMIRAYSYFYLAERFCPAYSAESAGNPATGVPIVTDYDPTDDNAQYPGRNTLEETYDQIFADLELALEYLLEYENSEAGSDEQPGACAYYVTSDAVKAMMARAALARKNYTVALKYAEEIINSRTYSLQPSTSLEQMWLYDDANELILLITMTQQYQTGSGTGQYFLTLTGNPAFVPTQASIDLFDQQRDYRFDIYFKPQRISLTEATSTVFLFNKYPGNPWLIVSTNGFKNMGKPFRLAEQYLIAAEAAAELGQESKANRYPNELKSRRISGYTSEQQTGLVLRDNIRQERSRELFGEGFRFGDLKRWGEGFERSEGQDNAVPNTNGNTHRLSYEPGDYRFIWPIPKTEIDANPQIKQQQNPGY
ncbi:MAG: RagB/SusD family nutrient uptake outer membrane protein [Rikenellaceae bacterium]|nr:RagB/SusD family nutrient uptake outer membrane protein [Rikenellaceae bacterium]